MSSCRPLSATGDGVPVGVPVTASSSICLAASAVTIFSSICVTTTSVSSCDGGTVTTVGAAVTMVSSSCD
ncbi:hypothetical protein H0E87_020178, partial [Populus deltoides]